MICPPHVLHIHEPQHGRNSTIYGRYLTTHGQYLILHGRYSTTHGQYSTTHGRYSTSWVEQIHFFYQITTLLLISKSYNCDAIYIELFCRIGALEHRMNICRVSQSIHNQAVRRVAQLQTLQTAKKHQTRQAQRRDHCREALRNHLHHN